MIQLKACIVYVAV